MKKNVKNSKYVEDNFIPIKDINNGMITLNSNEKVCGVKIMPRNIFILEPSAQFSIIDSIKNVYNMIDYEFWIVVADRPVDINVYLSQLQLLYNNAQTQAKRRLIMEDIDKANEFTNNNITDTEYFLLFKEKNIDVVNKRVRDLISNFANAGLSSYQVSNDDLRMILDNFLNAGQTTTFRTVV